MWIILSSPAVVQAVALVQAVVAIRRQPVAVVVDLEHHWAEVLCFYL
jgi:hypothetical protein